MRARTQSALAEGSFLRRVDARAKIALALAAATAVMLPLEGLVAFFTVYVAFAAAAGIGTHFVARVRSMAFFLLVVFALDWAVVGLPLAVVVTLRLLLLATSFSLLFATTTPEELRLALERLRLPARFAFAFSVAFSSASLIEREWAAVIEAQRARGLLPARSDGWRWREWRRRLEPAVSLVVPAVVLMTQRAWSLHEAAAVRGFGAPARRPFGSGRMTALDALLLAAAAAVVLGVVACS